MIGYLRGRLLKATPERLLVEAGGVGYSVAVSLVTFSELERRGGEVVDVQKWGRRRLAYPIAKHRDGFYTVAKLKLTPEAAEPLERALTLNESVIRHLLVRLDEE